MAICEQYGQARVNEGGGGEVYSESEGSDYDPASESSVDSVLEETRSNLSILSIGKRSKPRGIADDPEEMEMDLVEEVDERSFEKVLKNIQDGQLEKLKVEECKIYLRKYALRLTGNKSTLIQRIKEHQEILDAGGEKKYPISTFVLDCKGDACTGDVVMFKQNVYEMYNLASRSATGPPCGTRTVAGRIVKEGYGAAKQQHTFTIEVLWSKGEKQLPPLYPLLIKGRNLYRFKTLRQIWEDEGERYKVLMEKHSRGSLARTDREARIQEKEKRKMLRKTRASKKEEPTKKQFQLNPIKKANCIIQETQQYKTSVNLGNMAPIPQHSGLSVDSRKVAIQATKLDVYGEKRKPVIQDRNSGISSDAMKKAGGVQRLALLPQCLGSSIFAVSMESGPQQPIGMPKQSETHCLEMKSRHQQSMSQHCKSGLSSRSAQFAREHQQLAIQPQQSDLLVDLSKLKNQPLQQSSFPLETRNVLLQTKVEAKRRESDKENRRSHNLEVKQKRSDYFGAGWPDHHSSYDQYPSACQNHIPPFKAIDYCSSKSSPKGQPLSTNHYHPMRPPQRPSYQQKQLCRHFAQGRCYYGDNCKFLHH